MPVTHAFISYAAGWDRPLFVSYADWPVRPCGDAAKQLPELPSPIAASHQSPATASSSLWTPGSVSPSVYTDFDPTPIKKPAPMRDGVDLLGLGRGADADYEGPTGASIRDGGDGGDGGVHTAVDLLGGSLEPSPSLAASVTTPAIAMPDSSADLLLALFDAPPPLSTESTQEQLDKVTARALLDSLLFRTWLPWVPVSLCLTTVHLVHRVLSCSRCRWLKRARQHLLRVPSGTRSRSPSSCLPPPHPHQLPR